MDCFVRAQDVEGGIQELLGVFVGCEERYFQVGAVLFEVYSSFFEGSVEQVYYLFAVGGGGVGSVGDS